MTAATSPSSNYDAYYFLKGCGTDYHQEKYFAFFEIVAQRILTDIGPATVLDAGCAMGYLVAALRRQGIEAHGIDVSEYAIANVPPDVRPFCRAQSIAEPLQGHFDLIVSVEVLEHMSCQDAQRAVANFCRHADDVLFSSTPLDYKEATHFNVQPPEYWAELFARHGFYRDVEFDASFLTPWAMRFRRSKEHVNRTIANYERRLWRLLQENQACRALAVDQRNDMASLAQQTARMISSLPVRRSLLPVNRFFSVLDAMKRRIPWKVIFSEKLEVLWPHEPSLWQFQGEDGSVTIKADLPPGRYYLKGTGYSLDKIKLHVHTEESSECLLAYLGKRPKQFRFCLDLSQPATELKLKLARGAGPAWLWGFAILKDEGPASLLSLKEKLLLWARSDPTTLKVGRSVKKAVKNVRAWVKQYRVIRSVGRSIKKLTRKVTKSLAPDSWVVWKNERQKERDAFYRETPEPGLFSLLTTAWNTPVDLLDHLARSILAQRDYPDFEWVLLDNGSTNPQTRSYLEKLAQHQQVKLFRVEQNLGIIGGMRLCLEKAGGRYVVPVDSDDYLYPDCLQILTWHIHRHDYPTLLYSDEDRLEEGEFKEPYLKPAWDPVLFLNNCYIAHLCAIDRQLALQLDVYGNAAANGCHDWDTFLRFHLAGHQPVHVPEVLYSWRIHPGSCAMDIDSKSYIYDSHRHVLGKFLASRPHAQRYRLELNPLVQGTPDWCFRRSHTDPRPMRSLILSLTPDRVDCRRLERNAEYPDHQVAALHLRSGLRDLEQHGREMAERGGLIHVLADGLHLEGKEWPWEALTLTELYPDVVMVGGRVLTGDGLVLTDGEYFGFGGDCGCPDANRFAEVNGFFSHLVRQRSVSAVSTMLAVIDAGFLADFLQQENHPRLSLAFLGAWLGAHAARGGKRIVASPHMRARQTVPLDWNAFIQPEERSGFAQLHKDLIPERRFWSPHLSLNATKPYALVFPAERAPFPPRSAGASSSL